MEKNDRGTVRVVYRHQAMPNQAFSAGPRIAPEMRSKIQQALLSAEGKAATAKLRAVYAGKDFVTTKAEEYAGLGRLLKDSIYYY
jgi:ABC-type phosphate/phosphonate transport system substrate-binding protein